MRISGIKDRGRWLTEDSNAQVIMFIKIPNSSEPTFHTFVSGAEAAALLATEQGQSFRRKFKGDFEETEKGFCDSQGNGERLSTNNSLPVVVIAAESLSTSSVNNSSVPSTTNPAVEKSVNAGRKRAESTRTRDSSTNNSLPVNAAESVGLSTSSTDDSYCVSSNPAGLINAAHQADVRSIPSTVCTTSQVVNCSQGIRTIRQI
ncbi:uncharacterized protein LOC124196162 [Daphnia pulex]|uniref:uncharacterized protein LOC124196162 n=1 Tax=Daphnia pulex TaxID=6669 RepID=UPI001EDF449B|nr:uncharacterized protein LOC124196162 [Daphnia pulex]